MKKLFLSFTLLICVAAFSQAQNNTIGVRSLLDTELSFQHYLNKKNRVEIDLGVSGWKNSDFVLTGIYQWLFPLENNFNFYAGLGPQLGSYWYGEDKGRSLGIALAGQAGIEYNFSFPLQLSLDWRPNWVVLPHGRSLGYEGIALGIRYRF